MFNKPTLVLMLMMLQLSAFAQQMYKLDLKKSKILWDAKKTMGRHHGFIYFSSGSLIYAVNGQPSNGTFMINMKSIKSTDQKLEKDNQRVDGQLKNNDFFNVAKYPTAVMNVQKIVPTSKPTIYKVSGELTIKGITHPIAFDAQLKKNGNSISATAALQIDRTKWNINHKPKSSGFEFWATLKDKVVADYISISLDLQFYK